MPAGASPYQFASTLPRRLGYGLWVVLGILALYFFRERALFTDAAFQNFQMLQSGQLYIAHDRFGNVLPQLLPWLVMKVGGSLQAILLTYSLSLILFFAFIYWLLVNRLQNDYLGWTLILYYLLLTYDSFYHVQSELYQSTAWLLVFFGIILRRPSLDRLWQWASLATLALLLAFFHKLSIVFFLFVWIYFLLIEPKLRTRRFAGVLLLTLGMVLIKSVGWQSPYEAGRIDIFQQALHDYFPNFWDLPANVKFLKKCLWYYPLFPVFLGGISIWYLRKKQLLRLAFLWSAVLGYILLVHYSSPNTSYRFYAEVTYRGLGLIVGLPFLFEIAPYLQIKRILLPILITILLLRLGPIIYNGFQFRQRLHWIEQTLRIAQAEEAGSLFRMYSGDLPESLITDWALPYESLLLTALDGPGQAATLLSDDDFMELYEQLQKSDLFLTRFEQIPLNALNHRFFLLEPGSYRKINPE